MVNEQAATKLGSARPCDVEGGDAEGVSADPPFGPAHDKREGLSPLLAESGG